MSRRAIITGITGQDGSYLAELLLEKGYEVHGVVRPPPVLTGTDDNPSHVDGRVAHLEGRITLHRTGLEDEAALRRVIAEVAPQECYHLAGVTWISYEAADEASTLKLNTSTTHRLLVAIREAVPTCRFFLAGSSELFGRSDVCPQDERTPLRPRGVYGISKAAAFELTRMYREMYGMHTSTGFLYNHESPRRGYTFVTRKITRGAAAIKLGLTDHLSLGSLDARRDWGHARDTVRAMWLMLQQPTGDDYVVATGKLRTVRDLCEMAFAAVGLDYRRHVRTDPNFSRPPETTTLCGNPAKARQVLGWEPTVSFEQLVREMVETDLAELAAGAAVKPEVQVFVGGAKRVPAGR